VIIDAPTPTAVALPPSSIVITLVLLDVHVTTAGVVVAVSVNVCVCPACRFVIPGEIDAVGVGVVVVGVVGVLGPPHAIADSASATMIDASLMNLPP
jgi:hypothetical protein